MKKTANGDQVRLTAGERARIVGAIIVAIVTTVWTVSSVVSEIKTELAAVRTSQNYLINEVRYLRSRIDRTSSGGPVQSSL